ncbi:DNA packaging protein UL33 [Equid alphaherpesvirus 4]|nr:DNA packaging protein UL33 [Equid alphaherpesvirus 4]QYL35452.1 DNA packaging protein UL33 [Equid alphaherpesvirus 4]
MTSKSQLNAISQNVSSVATGNMSTQPRQALQKKLRHLIPHNDLESMSLDALDDAYGHHDFGIWFEDLMPPEMELLMPTTDAKLNYLSFTRRLASSVFHAPDNRTPGGACDHTSALNSRKERFATIINKFLDLHQILHDA